MNQLQSQDPEIFAAVELEVQRQRDGLEMIASENYTSSAVMQAMGSVLTNKYAEGYPGRRYYGGCEHVDTVEEIARKRACELFGAEHANVQPHSGSQANMAVYLTVLEPEDTVLGLDLAHGGHLTHGMRLNVSGKLYNFHSYGVTPDTHRIDFDQVARLAREHKPKVIIAGASAVILRLVGFGVQAAAESDDGMNAVQYLVPLLGIAVAIAIIGRPRRRAPRPAASPAQLAEA